MKKIIFILPVLLTFIGCNDFLDEVSQDRLIPEKPEHYAAVMLQEFSWEYPLFYDIDHMTDNVSESAEAITSQKFGKKPTYTWQREIEFDENGARVDNNTAWRNMYEDIAIMNYTIEQIDEAIGDVEEINFVKGEAYFLRALSYFNLLNLYGVPYNAETANSDLGVALRDNLEVNQFYNRNTVAESYELIENDLMQAIELISMSGLTKSDWHPDLAACYVLMSRVKLYQEQWQETVDYATKAIELGSLTKVTIDEPWVTASNKEILFSYYTIRPAWPLVDFGTTLEFAAYRASSELIDLYDENDLRKEAFFMEVLGSDGSNHYRTKKYQTGMYTNLGFTNIRVAEAYLNRGEAYAHLEDVGSAVSDMAALLAKRYSNTSDIVYPTTPEETLTFVLNERRKEFCFEDHHRWFDLRRMKNRPEIKHIFTIRDEQGVKLSTETYTLLPDDLNYTLPIPLYERNRNPLIRNNERYEKLPETVDEIIVN
ncbi:RagB/SusD family nutrient uptake outer membrane protein [Aestuariibaculum sp. YM273]|uniref:RagB/SusD family nutrient uptake outer membrane protein n=1 Tax=Aestuariibaculum sp. YM273 TaxID=3070659 RepID=UPI0027DE408D|nr:RagB/SusD family nutrient uptake outer membrane protein [Aestuariibaculum sp. YM273]WMI66023.1 RagB/SusD family nutrient uptake outer membrane protein [Aestuariibaculum sp. YM273]